MYTKVKFDKPWKQFQRQDPPDPDNFIIVGVIFGMLLGVAGTIAYLNLAGYIP